MQNTLAHRHDITDIVTATWRRGLIHQLGHLGAAHYQGRPLLPPHGGHTVE